MDRKEAVAVARDYVVDLFSDEKINDVGLEEIEYDRRRGKWLVTVGLTRVTDANIFLKELGGVPRRSYKLVTIDEKTGQAISLKDREFSY